MSLAVKDLINLIWKILPFSSVIVSTPSSSSLINSVWVTWGTAEKTASGLVSTFASFCFFLERKNDKFSRCEIWS